MSSNVSLRSNLRIGTLADFRKGGSLVHAARGRAALQKLLGKLEPGRPIAEAAAMHLRPEQIAQVAWERPCVACGTFPEGPIATPDGVALAFRCPRQQCEASHGRGRALLLDDKTRRLAARLMASEHCDLSVLVCRAIQSSQPSAAQLEGGTSRTTVRLAPTLDYVYRAYDERRFSGIVKAALRQFGGTSHAGDQRRQARVGT